MNRYHIRQEHRHKTCPSVPSISTILCSFMHSGTFPGNYHRISFFQTAAGSSQELLKCMNLTFLALPFVHLEEHSKNDSVADHFLLQLINKENLTQFSCPFSTVLSDRASQKKIRYVIFSQIAMLTSKLQCCLGKWGQNTKRGKGEQRK